MAKVLYILSALCAAIGFLDTATIAPGSSGATEGGFLLIIAVMLGAAGFGASRLSTKICPACASRVPISASKCKHCSSDLQ